MCDLNKNSNLIVYLFIFLLLFTQRKIKLKIFKNLSNLAFGEEREAIRESRVMRTTANFNKNGFYLKLVSLTIKRKQQSWRAH